MWSLYPLKCKIVWMDGTHVSKEDQFTLYMKIIFSFKEYHLELKSKNSKTQEEEKELKRFENKEVVLLFSRHN